MNTECEVGAMEKAHGVHEVCCNLKNSLLVLLNATAESGSGSLENYRKTFLEVDLVYKKIYSSNTLKIYRNIYRKNLSAIMY